MSTITTVGFYIVKQEEDGSLLIFLPQPADTKSTPMIIYDGKDHALFVRSPEQRIILDYLNPDIRKALAEASRVTIVEAVGEEPVDSYEVIVSHADEIPVDWAKYGLDTWDNELKKAE